MATSTLINRKLSHILLSTAVDFENDPLPQTVLFNFLSVLFRNGGRYGTLFTKIQI